MKRFADDESENVWRYGQCGRCPEHVARKARWIMVRLIAARGMQDVAVIAKGKIGRGQHRPGRHGINVEGKWFVGFSWEADFGAVEIALEKRRSRNK